MVNQSGSYAVTEKAENQLLLKESGRNGLAVTPKSIKHGGEFHGNEKTSFLEKSEPVRLSPAWEEDANMSNDELNFKNMTMDQATLEMNPPKDRLKIVYLILMLHGIGVLMPWNMFITAKSYFVDYKLSEEYTDEKVEYGLYFVNYITLASQLPNLLFNWLNIFMQFGGNLTTRVVWSIFVEVVIFVLTVILAMSDTSSKPAAFFWITMASVIVLNIANGIYQNTVYGMGARLPPNYTGAIILGSNISGTFTAVINLLATFLSPSDRTAAIYYFITALFVLLACFDTYFALPLIRFYRYNEYMISKQAVRGGRTVRQPYCSILWASKGQLLNVLITFFVTLTIFPAMHSDIKSTNPDFIIPPKYYIGVMCFFTFNFTAMLGSCLTSWIKWPGPRFLWILVWLRVLFIPFFLFCNYSPNGIIRELPVFIENDWIYLAGAILMGFSSGYCSSLAMMFVPGTVEPKYAATAGMFGGAVLITGIVGGILFSLIFPLIIS